MHHANGRGFGQARFVCSDMGLRGVNSAAYSGVCFLRTARFLVFQRGILPSREVIHATEHSVVSIQLSGRRGRWGSDDDDSTRSSNANPTRGTGDATERQQQAHTWIAGNAGRSGNAAGEACTRSHGANTVEGNTIG